MTDKIKDTVALLDFAIDRGNEGFYRPQALDVLGWPQSSIRFYQAVNALRGSLAQIGYNLVCDDREPGNLNRRYHIASMRDDARPWNDWFGKNVLTRVRTWIAVNNSFIVATDGRTADGRKARIFAKHLNRLVEDLEEIES